MKFLNYLLEQYEDWTEGFSGYSDYTENAEDSFKEDINLFFNNILTWTEDVENIANKYGADIIHLAMMKIAEYTAPGGYYYGDTNPLKRYCELENFVGLAIDTLYETHYNKFLNVFMER